MIPRLETERLILREYRPEDFEAFAAIMADPDVTRYLHGQPMARSDAWRLLAGSIGHWTLRGYGTWAVERKTDGAFIGRVGLVNPEGWPGLEVGWTLGKPYWGNGYATEAARASLGYAFLTQPVDRMLSCIDPHNKASQAVALRLGESKGPRRDIIISGKAYVADIWSISRAEWRAQNA
ncbi:MAG: GNAT family N-acetyltransferase [Alphaproteobacteria bacterium]|nr:GNAT family N-acetyltransferase [Alphaproteobacteria bacterium]MDE1985878.1 GNAT family N-acetyltransferase [Alphaproteobacteria bacterium]MDE2163242.1 GNAT family N-acetyltransferase [Alphaproteobacteria bacterium]MDE2266165.1 GNAT family N-acetyltransferase [Alphaproteobacteria bacterium]MDE2498793.1 GNAT family N-acetyltransferase [Alphaproteobacteria bacterium]